MALFPMYAWESFPNTFLLTHLLFKADVYLRSIDGCNEKMCNKIKACTKKLRTTKGAKAKDKLANVLDM